MKKAKSLFIVVFISSLVMLSCGNKKSEKSFDILKQNIPKRGEAILKVEEVKTFIPLSTNEEALDIESVKKDNKGNYYFASYSKIRIFKYSSDGKFLRQFLKKGQGPGELPYFNYFQVIGSNIFVSGFRKLIKFNDEGELIKEYVFKKAYWPIEVVNNEKFISTFNDIKKKSKNNKIISVEKSLGFFDIKENLIKKYVSTEHFGMLTVKLGKNVVSMGMPGLCAALEWSYNRKDGIIYYAITDKYKIYALDLKGKNLFTFGKEYKKKLLSHEDKKKIANNFRSISDDLKKEFIKQIPDEQVQIIGLKALSSGNLIVYVSLFEKNSEMDLFDNKGNYIYRLKLPDNLKNSNLNFFDDGNFGVIEERENFSVFTEYKVINPKGLF